MNSEWVLWIWPVWNVHFNWCNVDGNACVIIYSHGEIPIAEMHNFYPTTFMIRGRPSNELISSALRFCDIFFFRLGPVAMTGNDPEVSAILESFSATRFFCISRRWITSSSAFCHSSSDIFHSKQMRKSHLSEISEKVAGQMVFYRLRFRTGSSMSQREGQQNHHHQGQHQWRTIQWFCHVFSCCLQNYIVMFVCSLISAVKLLRIPSSGNEK